jgi:rhombotail lipoprotein
MKFRLTLLLVLLLSGCASSRGFDREGMQALLHQDGGALADRSLAPAATEQPASPGPFRLGLYFVHRQFPAPHTTRQVDWLSADKDLLATLLAPLQTERILTDTFLLVDSTIQGNDVKKIRQVGARYGADLVVTFDGVAAVDRYNNRKASLLYWTILGAYVADGTQSDALCLVRASVWDVKSGRLLASEEAEGRAEIVGPAAFVDDGTTVEQAKRQALEELRRRIAEQLRRWRKPS